MLTFSALILVSGCGDEQQEAAKNVGDVVVEKTGKVVDATNGVLDAIKDAAQNTADTVENTTSKSLDDEFILHTL